MALGLRSSAPPLAAAALLLAALACETPGPPPSPAGDPAAKGVDGGRLPNFVVVLTDDQGWGTTSIPLDPSVPDSRSDFFRTPNLERLASQGLRFTQAYAAHPNCSPSRAALQTGRSPAALHLTDNCGRNSGPFYEGNRLLPPQNVDALPESEVTLPEILKAHHPAYRTAHFGKWHLGGSPEEIPETYALASPIAHVDPSTAPALLLHGNQDDVVPFEQSIMFKRALEKAGVHVEFYEGGDAGHGFFNRPPFFTPTLTRLEEFLLKVFE